MTVQLEMNLKNASAVLDIAGDVASLLEQGQQHVTIAKLCLKTVSLIINIINALKDVPEKVKEDMLQNLKSLQQSLEKIKDVQQQELHLDQLDKQEIDILHSEIKNIEKMLKDLNEQAKHSFIKRMYAYAFQSECLQEEKLKAIGAKINLVTQKSTFIVTTLIFKLTVSLNKRTKKMSEELNSEFENIRCTVASQCNALKKQVRNLTTLLLVSVDNVHSWNILTDSTVTPPEPPKIIVNENEGKLFVKWETQCNNVDVYRLSYDEEQKSMLLPGDVDEATIGPPEVKLVPGEIYTIKMCGINSGGMGEWSNLIVQQFTKPCPSKPDPPKICSINVSRTKLTLTAPKLACPTESPITEWQVEYTTLSTGNSNEGWKLLGTFTATHMKVKESYYIDGLITKENYSFRAKAKNAEGWSSYSKQVSFEMIYSPCACGHMHLTKILTVIMVIFYCIYICLY